jgi:type IV secretion system protein VirB6
MLGAGLPFYDTIVVSLLTQVDLLLKNFVFDGYTALSNTLTAPLTALSTLYIVFFGMSILIGKKKATMGEFIVAVLKIGFVTVAVTNWGFVSKYLVGFINGAVGQLGDALISASPIHIPGADGIDGALQMTLIQFTQLGSKLFNTGGFSNFGGWFEGTIIWGFGYALVAVSLFEIILAKVMLAVLFVFTPLMALFNYFKIFQTVFDKWVGAIVGFALLQLFVTATLALALSISYWWLAAHMAETALQIGNYGTLPIIIIGVVCLGLVFKAASLAQNLGGMASSHSGAAMVGGLVGGFMGSAAKAAQPLRKGAGLIADIVESQQNKRGGAAGAAASMFDQTTKDLQQGQ